ncbi:MAG: hypothetical protein J6X57_02190 [Bacteroidales bacterium]|nr:hypothetical protein [Bacteroidales bacterium]
MKSRWFLAAAATFLCCIGCVSVDNELGGSFLPVNHTYKVVSPAPVEIPVQMKLADSLSAYSSTRITIGAIRNDEEFGLSTRSSCLTLVPMYMGSLDFGTNPVFQSFHFTAVADSSSVCDLNQHNILQSVYVYELSEQLDTNYRTYCKTEPAHGTKLISTTIPVIGNKDSLSFNFTKEFAERFFTITEEESKDINLYTKRFPGIYITTGKPVDRGGRFNMYQLQLQYDSDHGYIKGSAAALKFNSTFKIDGEDVKKDTTCWFYFSATDFYDIDSLLTNSGTGSFPQYCANITGDASASKVGPATDVIYIEGGGGVKPVISAKDIRAKAVQMISANGHDPKKAVINKATITLHYMEPDPEFETMYKVPEILSPTCLIHGTEQGVISYMGLTDASDKNEDQGSIHRAQMTYTPDITYHLQRLLGLEDDTDKMDGGDYDIWLLVQHNDVTTTTTSGNTEMSEYFNYLAYQSMMSSMYGGGYGYGGYGYGGYGYSNYYNYAMMAQYYGSSTTSSTSTPTLDRDRYYYCRLYGPDAADPALRPSFSFTYSIPNE